MAPRTGIGELETSLLWIVMRLREAHGAQIREELKERSGRRVGPGTLYPTLERLETKGFLSSRLGEPTPARGGRAKKLFALTPAGLAEVQEAWRIVNRLAEGLEDMLADSG